MAYQPIISVSRRTTFAPEALVRSAEQAMSGHKSTLVREIAGVLLTVRHTPRRMNISGGDEVRRRVVRR